MSDLVVEIVEGPDAGLQVELRGPLEIGRDPICDLSLTDELVSRRHARVAPSNGAATAEDLGSSNGTFLNGLQLHGTGTFSPGDHMLLGVTVLELRTHEDVRHRPTAVRPIPPAFAVAPREPDYVLPDVVLLGSDRHGHKLDPLLDVRTKHQARMAPLGILLLVSIAIILYLALR